MILGVEGEPKRDDRGEAWDLSAELSEIDESSKLEERLLRNVLDRYTRRHWHRRRCTELLERSCGRGPQFGVRGSDGYVGPTADMLIRQM